MPDTTLTLTIEAHRRHERRLGRRLRAVLRHTVVIFREFAGILAAFFLTLLVSAFAFWLLWTYVAGNDHLTFVGALYVVVTLMFFEPSLDFPGEPYLELFFFLMPVLGLIFLTLGVADFAQLLFQRRTNQQEWEDAMASTFQDHIIVAGIGHLGLRVVRELVVLDEEIVAIEVNPDNHRLEEVRGYDIPVITGDARYAETLRRAGIDRASALIIATNNDLANLQIASRVRETNKQIRLVMRMFDDEFARTIANRFDVSAVMSASLLAAPAFAGAATATEIIQTFRVADRVLVMGRIDIQAGSRLDGCQVGDIGAELDVSIVLLETNGSVDVRPQPEIVLRAGNVIAVVAEMPKIRKMTLEWNRPART